MRSTLASPIFCVFVIWSCLVLGGSLYEATAVWPLVASDPPRTLAATNPVLAVPSRAGMFFWSWVTPVLGLVALAALLTSFGTPRPRSTWRIASAALVLVAVAATLLYFRPTIVSLVVDGGGGRTADEIAADMHRWVMLNWLRVVTLAASIVIGARALLSRS